MAAQLAAALASDPALAEESLECFKELARRDHILCRDAWEIAAVVAARASLSKKTGCSAASFQDIMLRDVAPLAGQGQDDILDLTDTEVGAVKEREIKLVYGMIMDHLVGPEKELYKDYQYLLSRVKEDLETLFVDLTGDLTGQELNSKVQPELSMS
eukprot:s301_g13.t1